MMLANNLIPPNLRIKPLPLREIWRIFKRMFALLKEQSTLWTPIVRMVFLNIILFFLLMISVFYLTQDRMSWGLTLLGITLLGFIIRSFYFGYLFGILSAMVLLYLHGNEISLKNARHLVHQHVLSLGILHILANMLTKYFKRRNANLDKPSMLIRLIFSSVSIEALDLFGHFLVPVIVVENVSLPESFNHLHAVRTHLPASLAGLFGVDITKNVLAILFIPLIFIVIALCVLLGEHAVNLFPPNTIVSILNITFSWLPTLAGILFLIFVMTFLRPCMDGLKIIYFTLLYTLIRHPEKIQPAKKAEFMGLIHKH